MVYDNFPMDKEPIIMENSTVFIGSDGTCIKQVDLPKCISRLDNEAKCLKILDGCIAPKLIEYDSNEHALRMEYINGDTLSEYVNKHGRIPKYFFAKVVSNLLKLLDYGIEYGGDRKINEHFLIVEEKQDVRIIDFGISNIYKDRNDVIDRWRELYKTEFAFVFNNANIADIERSKLDIYNQLYSLGISKNTIESYFNDYDRL